MRTIRRASLLAAMTAAAALPIVAIGPAGAQDAGNCGEGATAVAAEQENIGGLVGAPLPILIQVVAPVNAPVLSPSQETCNENSNSLNAGGGSHGGGTTWYRWRTGGRSVPVASAVPRRPSRARRASPADSSRPEASPPAPVRGASSCSGP